MLKVVRFGKTDSQSLNQAVEVDWDAPDIQTSVGFWTHTAGASRITINDSGFYLVQCSIAVSGSVTRGNVGIQGYVDGTAVTSQGLGGYVRNASGHTSASSCINDAVEILNGQEFWIEAFQAAASGTLSNISGASSLVLAKIG